MLIPRLEAKGSTLWGLCEAQGSTLGGELGWPEFFDSLLDFHRKMLMLNSDAKGSTFWGGQGEYILGTIRGIPFGGPKGVPLGRGWIQTEIAYHGARYQRKYYLIRPSRGYILIGVGTKMLGWGYIH